jgi:hypothetical protein
MRHAIPIAWSVAALGMLLKLAHLPPASLLLILSLSTLAVLYYLPLTSVLVIPEVVQELLEVFVVKLGRSALAMTLVGTLFTLQRWPGSHLFMLAGVTLCLISIGLLLRLGQRYPDLKENYQRPMAHLALVLAVAVAGTLWVWSLGAPAHPLT